MALAPSLALALALVSSEPAPPESAAQAPAAAPDPARGAEVRVHLRDGQVLQGRLVSRDEAELRLEVAGAPVTVPSSAVARLEQGRPSPAARHGDPGRTRYLYSPSAFTSELGSVIVSVSALARAGRRTALVTENWLVPVDGELHPVGSAALRFFGESVAIDAGFVFTEGVSAPIPWLDFTVHWR
jgi:hypothetical protein